jgi:hypothetical protein
MSVVVPPEESSKTRLVILEADSEAGDSSRTFVFRHFPFTHPRIVYIDKQ